MSKAAVLAVGLVLGCAAGFALRAAWTSTSAAAPPAAAAQLSAEGVAERARAILLASNPLLRMRDLGALLAGLGPDALPALLSAFDEAPLDGGDPEIVLFATWWSGFDPKAARAWTTTEWRAQFGSVIAAVFRQWAHRDPKQAMSEANALYFPVQRQLAVDAVIAGWDESGQPGLHEMLNELKMLDQQRVGEVLARRMVVSRGVQGAIDWAESLENPAMREMMALRVASAAAGTREGAPVVAAWAAPRIAAAERPSGYPRRIATRWIKHDPIAAMKWLESLPAGVDRDEGVSEGFRDWSSRNPSEASAWIEQLEMARWNEPAQAVYARMKVIEQPREALARVQKLTDPELRETTSVVLVRSWIEKEPQAAEEWLAQSNLSEDAKKRARAVGTTPRRERIKAGLAPRPDLEQNAALP